MFCTSRKTGQAERRSALRPQLETLEDRLVPSITDGTVLLGNLPGSPTSTAPTGIVGVNPQSGAQSIVSRDGLFSVPGNVREDSTDDTTLYVTDYAAFPGTGSDIGGAVFRVDANTGHQSLVAKGGFINGPSALAVINHMIYISDVGDDTGTFNNIVEINPSNGHQRLISSGGNFSSPLAIAPAPGNNIYVSDIRAFGTGAIFEVSLSDGHQTVISKGGVLRFPVDMGEDPHGNLIVFNRDSATDFTVGAGSILRVDPHTGSQTVLASDGILSALDGGTVARDGTIYAGTTTTVPPTAPARVIAVNPVTGALRIVSQGGDLDIVEGMTVYYTYGGDGGGGGGDAAPAASSPAVLLVAPIQPETLAAPLQTSRSLPHSHGEPQAQPVQCSSSMMPAQAVDADTEGPMIGRQNIVATSAIDSFFADWGRDVLPHNLTSSAILRQV